jgi:hypothetical protein
VDPEQHFSSIRVDPGQYFSSIRMGPGPYIVISPENTYPQGKHGEIKVHRSKRLAMHTIRLNY